MEGDAEAATTAKMQGQDYTGTKKDSCIIPSLIDPLVLKAAS
jgi:hypothetical protein